MHTRSIAPMSWIALTAAIVLWLGVVYFVWVISSDSNEHRTRIITMDQESSAYTESLNLRSLARQTEGGRASLEAIASADVVDILDTVEALSRDVGIAIEVRQALSGAVDEASSVRTATFVVETKGSFSQVVHAAALLESLPLPSSLEELYFELTPAASGKSTWYMVARMNFYTTTDISS